MYIEFVCSEVRKTNFSTSGRHILHLVPRSELGMVSSRQTRNFAVATKGYSPMMSCDQLDNCIEPETVNKTECKVWLAQRSNRA
jgi:hypothetical protein